MTKTFSSNKGEAPGGLNRYKIADKITKVSKCSQQINSKIETEIPKNDATHVIIW